MHRLVWDPLGFFLATERNAQSSRKGLWREWGSPAERRWENLERSGNPENIPAGGDPLQTHFCGEVPSAEARSFPRPEGGFAGRRTRAPAPRGRGAPRVSAAARRGCCKDAARYGTVLPWQRSSARVIYSSRRGYNKISRLATADGIPPAPPRSLKPVYPKTHGLFSFCQHVILPSS